MVRVCEPVLGSRDDAEDCASDALAAAIADPAIDRVDNLEAWLVAVAKRRATDVQRRHVRNRRRLLRLAGRCEVSSPDVADHVADEHEARWLSRRAEEVLTPPARAVLGVVADGGTVDDAAARLAMSRRSAESHLHRARVALRAARVAVPAFAATVFRNGRRPVAATSAVLVSVAVFVPAIHSPGTSPTPPHVQLAPSVVENAAAAPAQPIAERRTAPARAHRRGPAVVRPLPAHRASHLSAKDPVAEIKTDKADVSVGIEEQQGPEDPVGILLDCVARWRIDREHVGC